MQLLDSTWAPPWNLMAESTVVYRFVIRRGSTVDTVADVLEPIPVAIGDTAVAGIRLLRTDTTRQIFVFVAMRRHVSTYRIPADVFFGFTDIAPSPTGLFVAYVGGSGGPRAMIRRLDGTLVLQGTPQGGCDCDVDLNHARWVTADSFEIAVANVATVNTKAPWILAAGSVRHLRLRESGLANEPKWHDVPRPSSNQQLLLTARGPSDSRRVANAVVLTKDADFVHPLERFGGLARWYNRSYTSRMKTAISLPDALFESAEALAHRLGVTRSELFATAVAAFIAHHDRTRLTARLNAVYADAEDTAPDLGLATLQSRSLAHDPW